MSDSPPYNLAPVSSGIAQLDALLEELRIGDNVVFLLDRIDDYAPFAEAPRAPGRTLR